MAGGCLDSILLFGVKHTDKFADVIYRCPPMCLISSDLSQGLVHDGDAVRVVDVEAKAEVNFLLFVVVVVDGDGIVLAGDVINLEELRCQNEIIGETNNLKN